MKKHNERAHAILSASSSERWLNCPPSARLEELEPNTTSIYADEGTRAHELAELLITAELKKGDAEMLQTTTYYKNYVMSIYSDALKNDENTKLMLEQQLDLSNYIPNGFGTVDALVVSKNEWHVIDFKYGKGVNVLAENNTQLMIYALGAVDKFKEPPSAITLHIVQPRIWNAEKWKCWSIKTQDLVKWGDEIVKPTAKLSFNGQGDFKIGSWCRFCRVSKKCKKRKEETMDFLNSFLKGEQNEK